MNEPALSVIVPVYNVEKYISQCIISILEQSFTDYELLLVIDGASSDGSGAICERFALLDARIAVFYTAVRSLASVRNYGITMAKADALVFVDSDDYLPQYSLSERMSLFSDGIDIVTGRFSTYNDLTGETSEDSFHLLPEYVSGLTGKDAFEALLSNVREPLWSASRSVFRKSLFENGYLFRDGLISEDMQLIPGLMMRSSGIAVYDGIIYTYRIKREGSIMNIMSYKRIADTAGIINEWLSALETIEISSNCKRLFKIQLAGIYYGLINKIFLFKGEDRRRLLKIMKESRSLLNSENLPGKFRLFYKMLGFYISCLLLHYRYNRGGDKR